VTEIATEIFDPDERARIAMEILGERDAADGTTRSQAGLVGCHSPSGVLVLEHAEVRGHLARELVFRAIAAEEIDEPNQESSHHIHS
jgi:hypothetical protein